MKIVWDPFKARSNLAKHGVEFRVAARIFEGPTLHVPDKRRDYGEERVRAIGRVDEDILTVVFVRRGEDTRLISARSGSTDERRRYEAAFGKVD